MKYLLLLAILCVSPIALADARVAAAVEQTVKDNMRYMVEENLDAVMSTIHTQSLNYLPTQDILMQLIGQYKLSYEIVSYRFIGFDGELAYARVKQKTKKISGPAFQDNLIDTLQIFRQEDGVWKLWSQANMSVDYL